MHLALPPTCNVMAGRDGSVPLAAATKRGLVVGLRGHSQTFLSQAASLQNRRM